MFVSSNQNSNETNSNENDEEFKVEDEEEIFNKSFGKWMIFASFLTCATIFVGSLTRLTGSGLSMVEWKALGDMILPNSDEQWLELFEKYKQFPEYEMKNGEMTLSGFKYIFFMEYFHRMCGRMTGLSILLTTLYYTIFKFKTLSRSSIVLALTSSVLVCFQGFFGWYMVKSGLKKETMVTTGYPAVSQYRLLTHQGVAFIIFYLTFWNGLHNVVNSCKTNWAGIIESILLNNLHITNASRITKIFFTAFIPLLWLTSLSGALVASTHSGLVYNSYPKMADRWIPTDLFAMQPLWKNFFENPTTIQFVHRVLTHTSGVAVFATFLFCLNRNSCFRGNYISSTVTMLFCTVFQIVFGIQLLVQYVPCDVAIVHSGNNIIIQAMALTAVFEFFKSVKIRRILVSTFSKRPRTS